MHTGTTGRAGRAGITGTKMRWRIVKARVAMGRRRYALANPRLLATDTVKHTIRVRVLELLFTLYQYPVARNHGNRSIRRQPVHPTMVPGLTALWEDARMAIVEPTAAQRRPSGTPPGTIWIFEAEGGGFSRTARNLLKIGLDIAVMVRYNESCAWASGLGQRDAGKRLCILTIEQRIW